MIEMGIVDLMMWVVGLTLVTIGLLRLLSKLRRETSRSSQRKSILYCNVCVKYFSDESDKKWVDCPKCGRPIRKGRPRNLG